MPIRNLSSHSAHYLTVGELAEYWAVSRQQIYKRIESGSLTAIRLGARIYRVPTESALEYERRAMVAGWSMHALPEKAGLRRVPKGPA
jgi:excisionase family DNA binding protein